VEAAVISRVVVAAVWAELVAAVVVEVVAAVFVEVIVAVFVEVVVAVFVEVIVAVFVEVVAAVFVEVIVAVLATTAAMVEVWGQTKESKGMVQEIECGRLRLRRHGGIPMHLMCLRWGHRLVLPWPFPCAFPCLVGRVLGGMSSPSRKDQRILGLPVDYDSTLASPPLADSREIPAPSSGLPSPSY
jgi:hypothetical protein